MPTTNDVTPAPWILNGDVEWIGDETEGQHRFLIIRAPEGGWHIALVQADEGDAEQAANARLIATAPEMLKALEKALEVLEYIDSHCGVKNEHGQWIPVDQKAISRARAAISKVRGQS